MYHLYAVFLLVSLIVIPNAGVASDLFTVRDVAISSEGKNAKEAKQEAVASGEQKAFRTLLEKITPSMFHYALPELEPEEISSMVRGVEIKEEKVTPNHYTAVLNISFNQERVRKILSDEGIASTQKASDPIVVLPVFYENGQMVLWQQSNAWRESWQLLAKRADFVPLVVAESGDELLGDIPVELLLSGDHELWKHPSLKRFISQHNAKKLFIAEARYSLNPSTQKTFLQVYLTHFDDAGITRETKTFSSNPGEVLSTVLEYSVGDIVAGLEAEWKLSQSGKQSSQLRVSVTIPVKDLSQWNTIRKRLESFNFLDKLAVKQLSIREVLVDMHFQTSYQQFLYDLTRKGLTLENIGNGLILKSYDPSIQYNNIM